MNHILAALPEDVYARLLPHLERVPLERGGSLYASGEYQGYVYFPATCIVSKRYTLEDGATVDVAHIGNEGVVGVALFMGGNTFPLSAVVRNSGYGFRIKGSVLKVEFERGGPLQHLFLLHTQALITQMSQTVVCNRHHSVEQQLCRVLLLSLDRGFSNELIITQEQIAKMLGVRREGVTVAANHLQSAGLIHYRRGRVTVLDRPQLEARVCECYAVVKREYSRLLPDITAV